MYFNIYQHKYNKYKNLYLLTKHYGGHNRQYYLNKTTSNGQTIQSSSDLSLYILDQTGVVTVAGDSFGAPSNIRLSYATSDTIIIEACKRMKATLSKL